MNVEELKESTEHAHHSGQKGIGLTTALVAVLLAVATLLGHRAHTEEMVLQGDRNTQWVNFDTKRMQRVVDEDFAILSSALPNAEDKTAEFKEKAKLEREGEPAKNGQPAREGSEKIREHALELDAEMKVVERRADHYDSAELFLEISIVLCSIALLAEAKIYWRLSFVTSVAGVALILWGFLLR